MGQRRSVATRSHQGLDGRWPKAGELGDKLALALLHVVIRNDVADRIPDEAGAGLLAAPFVRSGKIGKPIALPHHLESLACKPVSVACEPSLWLGLRRAPGNGFRTSETKGPNRLPDGLRFPQRPRTSHDTRPNPRKIEGVPRRRGNSGLALDCVVGPGGLEPATRPLSAPAGKFRIRRAQTPHRRRSQKGLAFCCEPSVSDHQSSL
jgi:hypothetical protein